MPKVLIVTYYWPPGSGAGVQRWLKFAKYLPLSGWEPYILTVDPRFAAYPAIDNSLENEIPESVTVYKTKARDYFRFYSSDKSRIPSSGFAANEKKGFKNIISRFVRGNFFIPDPRKGWNNSAFRKACTIIREAGIDHIITTSPPHSTQLIGLRLKKKFPGIRWIADLRDPWTDIYYYDQFYPTYISRKIDSAYELNVLANSDKIITVGNTLKELFSSKIPGSAGKIEVIPNGYDDEDFEGLKPSLPDKFTISYIGTLSDSYPVKGLLQSLCGFKNKNNDFIVRFVGFVSESQRRFFISALGEQGLEFAGYADHKSALRYMFSSTMLLLIIPRHSSSKSIITGKLFEYMATGRPVLCLGPTDGDAALYLKSSPDSGIFDWDDSEGIEKFISQTAENTPFLSNAAKRNPGYSRKELTRKLSEVLDNL